MRLTFLGTAAANAYPEAFCRCANCERARLLGGPSIRKRSAALINDDLLIDLGPDIHSAAALHHRPLTKVRFCLQTHAHADHLDASHLLSRSPAYGVVDAPRLQLYGSAATLQRLAELLARDVAPAHLFDQAVQQQLNIALHPVRPYEPFQVGPYRVIAFPANHDPSVEPLLFAIQSEQRTIFYGTDTAALPEAIWHTFHEQRLRFDLVIFDHTYGPGHPGDDHLNADLVAAYAARLRAEGLLAHDGQVLATHLAHDTTLPHPDLSSYAAEHGYAVAYDGLSI